MSPAVLATLTAASAVLVVGVGASLAMLLAGRRRLERELQFSRLEMAALQNRLDDQATAIGTPKPRQDEDAPSGNEYLITSLPDGSQPRTGVAMADADHAGDVPAVSRQEFASLALSESVVRLASLAHGVRRALSAENRNRIRFEMRREVKRSRKQRRLDLKEAKRQLRSRPDITEEAA